MPKSNISVDILKEAIRIKELISEYETKLEKLLKGTVSAVKDVVKPLARKGRRKMSAAGRARIAAAQKARWAKQKGTSVAKPAKKKRKLSAEGRARIIAAQKKRWDAKKKS